MSHGDLTNLSAVFLDFGNTIVDESVFIPAALRGIVAYVRRRCPNLPLRDEALLEQLRQTPCPLRTDHPRLRDVRGQSFDHRFETFRRFVQDCGLTMTDADDAAMMDCYDQAAAESDCLIKGAAESLQALAQRYRLVIVSNGYSGYVHRTLAHKGLERHFQAVLVSQDLNVQKPDPRIYHLAALAAQVPLERTLMVGDSLDADVCGAKALGMTTCWINPARQSCSRPDHCDYDLPSLFDLTSRLGLLPRRDAAMTRP